MNEKIIKEIEETIDFNRCVRCHSLSTSYDESSRRSNEVLGKAKQVIIKATNNYEKGMNDIWEAMRKLIKHEFDGGYSIEDTLEIVGHNNRSAESVIMRLSPQEVLDRIAEFDKKKEEEAAKPKLGDVVTCIGTASCFKAIFYGETSIGDYWVLTKDNTVPQHLSKGNWTIRKTGEHVDIQGLLDKLNE